MVRLALMINAWNTSMSVYGTLCSKDVGGWRSVRDPDRLGRPLPARGQSGIGVIMGPDGPRTFELPVCVHVLPTNVPQSRLEMV
jgi:hypothetical protein